MERLTQIGIVIISVVMLVGAMVATRDLTAPMVLALAFGIVLSPVSDTFDRLGLPPVASALVSLTLALILIGAIVTLFQPVATQLLEAAPKVFRDLQDFADSLRTMTRGLPEVPEGMAAVLTPGPEAGVVVVPTVTDALMLAPKVAGQVLTFAGTLFFFVLSKAELYDFAARRLAGPTARGVTAARLRAAERSVARYFLTITTINAVFGVALAAALHFIGLPGAAVWGTLSFVLNFVVYLGPAVLAVGLLFAGIGAFDGAMVLAPAAAFVTLNVMEGQFVTPALVGRNVEMNPLVVFVVLLFGIWVWGPIGGIVAIPLLLWARVLGRGESAGAAARSVAAR
jgi:predicted PurR-regulated permease PerM